MENSKEKKSFFESPICRSQIKSANVTVFETVLGFMIGPIGGMIASAVFAFYLFGEFYPKVMFKGESVTLFLTLLPLLSVATILAGNIFLGQVIQRTKTKAGKARPWIPLSAVFIAAATVLMFTVPGFGTTGKCIYAAITYNLYYAFAYPLYYTANSTLLSQSTRNIKHRNILSGAAGLASTAAVGAAGMFLPIVQFLVPTETDDQIKTFWFVLAIIVAIFSLVATMLQFFFSRERVTEEELVSPSSQEEKKDDLPLGKQFKAVSKDRYWWIILIFFLIFEISGQLLNNAYKIFSTNGIDNSIWQTIGLASSQEDAGSLTMSALNIIGAVPMALAGVIAYPLLRKFNKTKITIGGMVLAFLGGVIQGIPAIVSGVPVNPIFVIIGYLFKQLGRGVVCLFIMSMISDVNDHDEAMNGFRCAALTMSIYSAFRIIAQPLGQGLYMAISDAGASNAGVVFSFIWFDTIVYAIVAVMLLFFKVEDHIQEDQETIIERQKAECAAAGIEWIEPAERMRLEQEQFDKEAEENRIAELKAKCEAKGLNFEEEEAKYQAKLAAKEAKKKKPSKPVEEPAEAEESNESEE